jgi:hypothetical protein
VKSCARDFGQQIRSWILTQNLKITLNKLRRVLGDSAENPIYIETIPRQGYRFLPPVVRLECEPRSTGDAQPPAISKSADLPTNSSGTSTGPRLAGWQAISAVMLALVLVVCRDLCASNEVGASSETGAATRVAARAAF